MVFSALDLVGEAVGVATEDEGEPIGEEGDPVEVVVPGLEQNEQQL